MPYILLVIALCGSVFFAKRFLITTWNFQQIKYGEFHPQFKRKYIQEAHLYVRFYAIMFAGSLALIIISIYSLNL